LYPALCRAASRGLTPARPRAPAPASRSWKLFLVGVAAAALRFRLRVPKYCIWGPLALAVLIHPPLFDTASGRMHTRFYTPPPAPTAAAAVAAASRPAAPLWAALPFVQRDAAPTAAPAPPAPALGNHLLERLRVTIVGLAGSAGSASVRVN
jgi:hypothetical protein